MNAVFADSFYFFALFNDRDQAHARAVAFNRGFAGRMATTRWVLTELADGLCGQSTRASFLSILDFLDSDPDVVIVDSSDELWQEGIALYRNRPDKDWSLTDCISFVVMQREGLRDALTGDRHFEQAGFVALLK